MILYCGDALVEVLPRKTAAGEKAYAPCTGGANLNTAIAFGRLGVPTEFFSGISTDLFGRLPERTLADGILSKEAMNSLTDDAIASARPLGNRTAAVTVSRTGANPPWARDIQI